MLRGMLHPCAINRLLLWLLLLAAIAHPAFADTRAQPEAATGRTEKAPVHASKYMIVAAHPLAARAGLTMLRKGGSAVDAVIAAQMVLNLVEPQSSGIGGGAFLLHWNAKTKKLTSYDGRETAPAAARGDRFLTADGDPMHFRVARRGGRAVGVPGLLRVLEMAHAAHGKLPWADLFAPAIRIAELSFPVGRRLNQLLARVGPDRFNASARALFFDAAGVARPVGHPLMNHALAVTLRAIAAQGADAFYRGPVAKRIAAAVNASPGSPGDMTIDDLAGYAARKRAPVCAPYHVHIVCGMGPPSSGGLTVGQTLMLLDGRNLGAAPPDISALHLIGEAEKLAYADRRRYMADPGYAHVPGGLLDPAYITARRALIAGDAVIGKARAGTPPGAPAPRQGDGDSREQPGTTHISVIDAEGNALAMTSTIESAFGSGLMVGGFLLNNELTDFSFRPADGKGRPVANRVEGGKRPLSSMAPTILFDAGGHVKAVLGSPGGTRIILYVVKSIIALLDWNMNAQEAAALGNFGSRNRGTFEIETAPEADAQATALRDRGHTVRISPMTSGTHIILVRPDGLEGGADPRREGVAVGD